MKAHVETHLTGIVHSCELCGHKSSTTTALGRHKAKKHREELQRIVKAIMEYKCKFCGKGSRSRRGLETHRYKNHKNKPKPNVEDEEKPFKCKYCEKGSRSKKGLECHTYKNHKNQQILRADEEEKPFSCKVCEKGSLSAPGLAGHMYRHHRGKPKVEGKFKCGVCKKGSKTVQGREQHRYKYHHKNGRYFGKSGLDISLTESKEQQVELRPKVEEKHKPFICDKVSETANGREQHKYKYHHKNGRYFVEKTVNRRLAESEDQSTGTKEERYTEAYQETLAEEISTHIERMKEDVMNLTTEEELKTDLEESFMKENSMQVEDQILDEDSNGEKDRLLGEDLFLKEDGLLEESLIIAEADNSSLDPTELHQKSVSLCLREGNTWTCTKCGKKVEDKYKHNLFRHAQIHIEGLIFPCKECSNISKSSNGLWQHKTRVHNKGRVEEEHKPFTCNSCGKGSISSHGLAGHMQTVYLRA